MKNIIFDPPTDFAFQPGDYVPFKDREVCERLRKLSGKELEKHPNPDFHIKVMMNPHPVLIATLFSRIKEAAENDRKITLILGNPEPETYIPLAQLIIAVRLLGTMEIGRHLSLGEVGILTKIFDALIHGNHLMDSIVYHKK